MGFRAIQRFIGGDPLRLQSPHDRGRRTATFAGTRATTCVIALGRLCLIASVTASPGCAVRYVDAVGRVQTIGLVWTSHERPDSAAGAVVSGDKAHLLLGTQREPGPRWMEMKAVGVVVEATAAQASVTAGYKDSIWVFPVEEAVTEVDSQGGKNHTPHVSVRRP